MTEYGIDVSNWNTVTDWSAVRGNGVSFVSIKATESTGYASPAVAGQTNASRTAGVTPGGYHFARNDTTPEAQARYFAAECAAHALLLPGSFVPMLDLEAAELRGTADAFAVRFISAFRIYSGQSKIAVYSNLDWFQNVLHPAQWADSNVFLWIADWNGDPGHPAWSHPRLALHQHTDAGAVSGVVGNVDRNATVAPFTVAAMTVGTPSILPPSVTTPGDVMFEFLCNTDTFVPPKGNLSDKATTNANVVLLVGGGYVEPATWADVQAKDKTYGGDGTGSVLGLSPATYARYVDLDSKLRARDANLMTLGTVAAPSGGATPAQVTAIVDEAFAHHDATLTYRSITG